MEKEISYETLTDTWGHTIWPGVRFLKGNYLKPGHSRNIYFKNLGFPDEICNTYVKINEDRLLAIDVYNNLIQKAKF